MLSNEMIRTAGIGMVYRSGKNYTHSVGLSCCFRQWRAQGSHCRLLHGYALQVDLEFQSTVLDERNWVQDFGGLKQIKEALVANFDHKTLVASDDPDIDTFRQLFIKGIIDIVEVPAVGCEGFARIIYENIATHQTHNLGTGSLTRVTVREHEANWASYGVNT